ncbi:MAG: hypothetical protein ACYC3X_05470, partial [Pirellulaceae bacterium]
FLGHNSLATTQIYTHVSILKLREVHERTHPARLFRTPGAPAASAPPSESDPLHGDLDDEDGDSLWVPVA